MDGLRAARDRKGVTQERAARDLGIKPERYRSYEYGLAEPPLKLLKAMARYYCCSVDELVGFNKAE